MGICSSRWMICPTYHWFTKRYSKLVRTSTNIFFCHCSPPGTLHCLDDTSYCGFVVNHIHSSGVYACIVWQHIKYFLFTVSFMFFKSTGVLIHSKTWLFFSAMEVSPSTDTTTLCKSYLSIITTLWQALRECPFLVVYK